MELDLYITFACASISFTITYTSIFEPLRNLISRLGKKADQLIHCPWCFNHYVVFIVVAIFHQSSFLEYLLRCFAIIGACALLHYVMLRAYKPIAKLTMIRELQRLQKEN